ncbi:MAG: hypothetical protein ACUVTR_03655 [Dehalococcoidia bacterium]
MRKRKWFIPVVVASILLVGGITGAVAVAGSNSSNASEDQSQPPNRLQALLDRACAIYEEQTGVAIDPEQLKDALKQARQEMCEEALENWLQKLVEQGRMTQEQVDEYLEWWQSRPDIKLPLPGLGGPGPGNRMMRGRGFGPAGVEW